MKKVLLLSLAIILANQVLFAEFQPCRYGNFAPIPTATLPEGKEDVKTANIFTGKATDKATGYVPGPKKLLENSLYRLEFDAEKGVTLIGGNLADLVFRTTCLPLDLAAYEQLFNTEIEVLVNQQPMAIQATSLTAALRQIPAERIKAIELRTSFSDNPDLAGEAVIVIQVTQVR